MPIPRRQVGTQNTSEPHKCEAKVAAAAAFGRQAASSRIGWAEASKKLATYDDDQQVLPEIANMADANLEW